jgi:uncharacterized protein with beta-barrel porin domain
MGRIHAAVAEAIGRRDPAAAHAAMLDHFEEARRALSRRARSPKSAGARRGRNGPEPVVVSSVSHPRSKEQP